ncbi:AMP-binding enzyme family protein [Mycobacterium xenopi 3993]|nr:AMP-binding enzyme family protein [Mycobacterium xenopi 3993]
MTGRVKDVIHRGGETVAAQEVEEHLLTHPAIVSAAAAPLPDRYLGEKICAAVVFAGQPVTLAELNRYLDQHGVAVHARPTSWFQCRRCPPRRSARSTSRRSPGWPLSTTRLRAACRGYSAID